MPPDAQNTSACVRTLGMLGKLMRETVCPDVPILSQDRNVKLLV